MVAKTVSMVAKSSGKLDLRRGGGTVASERDNSLNSSSSQLSNHDGVRLPDAVRVPPSIDSSLLQGDILDILKPLPADRVQAAFDQYDHQIKLRGDEIRNKRAYLRAILKAPGGRRHGLPHGVSVPPSVTQSMLEDKELIDVLKNMSPKDINSCLRDFDEQIRKKSGMIRNKTAYLMGIIKSGPHYCLPQGVVLPSTVSLASLQGELLETIQRLPSAHINVAFLEYDEQIQKKGDSIRNKSGYLLGIMKRMKKQFEEEASEHVALKNQQASQDSPSHQPLSPSSPSHRQSRHQSGQTPNSPSTKSDTTLSILDELNIKPDENQQETLNLVTESFVKITNELVLERKARNDAEEEMRNERSKREEASQRVLKFMSELSHEKEQKERALMEVERLKKDLAFERALRETSEEKVTMLEDGRSYGTLEERKSWDGEENQLKKLEMELSIERGLREKTEKLLHSAEDRINELNSELQFAQEKLYETKSPFGNWMSASSPMSMTNGQDSDDKQMHNITPSLSGISELVSLTDFDHTTFSFSAAEDSRIVNTNSRLTSELQSVSSAYGENGILVTEGEVIRYLRLDANQSNEYAQVNLTLSIPGGYPDHGTIDINAEVADSSVCSDTTRKYVEESLPSLIEACRNEATATSDDGGRILSILTTADYWVQSIGLMLKPSFGGDSLQSGNS